MMLIAQQEEHDGWIITTSCSENKSDNWNPGDPINYLARAEMQLIDPQQYENGWKSVDRHSIPNEGRREFSAWLDAHKILIDESKILIDSLKR